MDLKEKINDDIKSAMKSGRSDEVSVLRLLSGAIKNKELEKRMRLSKSVPQGGAEEIEKSSALSGDEIAAVVSGEIKKRKEAAEQYKKGGRPELAEKELSEIEILKKYAPEAMSGDELRSIVKKKIAEAGAVSAKDFGKLIGSVMAEVKGRAGGEAVKKIIEEEIAAANEK